ncbi:hypothetical protein OsI_08305 [Oryza sativa Indica Group]|uniref:Uncharacterized protein n=1 Tax=Oryza sativa subsp. indica TaxID=39946 RepID=B8AG24_ORYSI|nr:hypothetical protein OsI_08305 [Oryza sativa Indica Group]
MLHHHSSSADMWDPCTGVPRWPAFVRRRPRYTHRQLLTPRSPHPLLAAPLVPSQPPPPDAPLAPIRPPFIGCASRAKPASISAACASRAEPAFAAIGCTSTPSRSPIPPPNDATPARCNRLPRPRLAVRSRHASNDRGHRHRSRYCQMPSHLAIAILTSSAAATSTPHDAGLHNACTAGLTAHEAARPPPRRLDHHGRCLASQPPQSMPPQPPPVTTAVGSRNHRQPDLTRGVVASSRIAGVTTGSRRPPPPHLSSGRASVLGTGGSSGSVSRQVATAPGRRRPKPPPNLVAELPGRHRLSLGDRIRPPRHRIRSAPTPCPELVPCRSPDRLGRERGKESPAAAVLAAARLCRRRRGWGGEEKGGDGVACSPPASPPGQGDRARFSGPYRRFQKRKDATQC